MININNVSVKSDLVIIELDNNDTVILTTKEYNETIHDNDNFTIESINNNIYSIIFDNSDPYDIKKEIQAFQLLD